MPIRGLSQLFANMRAELQATWQHGYWVLDMSNKCFHGWHLTFALTVGLVSVLLFCIGIPLATLLVLAWKVCISRQSLDDPQVIHDAGFLYQSFKYR